MTHKGFTIMCETSERPALDREGERRVEAMRAHCAVAMAVGHITWAEADRVVCAAYDDERKRMQQEVILRGAYT